MVFSTRERRPWIGPDVHDRLYAMIGGICKQQHAQLLCGNGTPDHVHLLVRFPPDLAPSVLAREVKARSSRWLHDTFPALRRSSWQRGYGGFTVSSSAVPTVERYIRMQPQHHARLTFKDEFVAMLRKHGIEFDVRYIFQ